VSWLRAEGHQVFLAQDPREGVAVGEQSQPRLYERLRWADAVVCLVDRAYRESVWCSAELAIAHERGLRIMPFLLDAGPPHPLIPSLHHVQVASLRRGDDGGDADAARMAMRDALSLLDAGAGRGWPDGRSPFPGLAPFDVDMHRALFGRRAEVERIAAGGAGGGAVGLRQVVAGPGGPCGVDGRRARLVDPAAVGSRHRPGAGAGGGDSSPRSPTPPWPSSPAR
jgi:hypothetical protein